MRMKSRPLFKHCEIVEEIEELENKIGRYDIAYDLSFEDIIHNEWGLKFVQEGDFSTTLTLLSYNYEQRNERPNLRIVVLEIPFN